MVTVPSIANNNLRLAIIDEDENVRPVLSPLLEAQGHQTRYFQSTEAFLSSGKPNDFDCILLEFWFKSGISGLDLLRRLAELGSLRPTIMMSALADADAAFTAAKLGAAAFLAKPLRGLQLGNALRQAIAPSCAGGCSPRSVTQILSDLRQNPKTLSEARWSCLKCRVEKRLAPELFRRLESLSHAEAKVFLLLALEGESNKRMAAKLHVGHRAVESHRSKVLEKLEVRSAQLRGLLDEFLQAAS